MNALTTDELNQLWLQLGNHISDLLETGNNNDQIEYWQVVREKLQAEINLREAVAE